MLAILPQFREENAEMEQWLPVSIPKEPDKAIVYPALFDFVKNRCDLDHPSVEVIEGTEHWR